ncbi:MAG: methionine ABC transporter substrate-binding protein [Cellulomonadaceae bacterium]|jgi:D-methionine transport system substrate-binding protein|nr:methionine ABC transporter substrate-binding protein [Cellulomonadaceae bacterium]
MRSRLSLIAKASALAVTAALTLSACGGAGGASPAAGTADDPIRIGVVNAEEPERRLLQDAARAEGIYIEWVNFSDFQLPNMALADGDLELNQFQHLQFLANFNVNTNNDLTPIGATAVFPLGLYSLRHSTVVDIPEGAEIAIPNDPTNQARALMVLQAAGLLALRDGGNSLSTPADIITAESRVTVIPVEAAQTAISLFDIDGSVVNNSMIAQVGLSLEDAIFADDPDSPEAEPFINVWVARAEDASNPTYARLVELLQTTPEVIDSIVEVSAGTAAIRNNSAADLQRILGEIETNLRNQ